MHRALALLALHAIVLGVSRAASIPDGRIAITADEQRCTAGPAVDRVQDTEPRLFAWFLARWVRPSDKLRVEWIQPDGGIALASDWGRLSSAASMCFLTPLAVAGSTLQPGVWTVRALINGRQAWARRFTLEIARQAGVPRIESAVLGDGSVVLAGSGFDKTSVIHIARYDEVSGWVFVARLPPEQFDPTRISARVAPLEPGDYYALATNVHGLISRATRLSVATKHGYLLPFGPGEPWIVTQGPHGSFSHFNRSSNAWDIAPGRSSLIVAMRAGVVHAYDLGLGQTPTQRIFGNYITIDHGGEYSHYAHLETGTFRVRTGQRVQQGQPLAMAGNSGYTIGPTGGHHVHVHVTRTFSISAQSIPFRFGDLADEKFRGPAVSRNAPPGARRTPDRPAPAQGQQWRGEVAVTEVWTELVAAKRGATKLELRLSWNDGASDLDLALISPRGRRFSWYEDPGPLTSATTSETFRIDRPEPGPWRVVVRGMRGTGVRVPFVLEQSP